MKLGLSALHNTHLHIFQAILHLFPPVGIKVALITLSVDTFTTEIQGEYYLLGDLLPLAVFWK